MGEDMGCEDNKIYLQNIEGYEVQLGLQQEGLIIVAIFHGLSTLGRAINCYSVTL